MAAEPRLPLAAREAGTGLGLTSWLAGRPEQPAQVKQAVIMGLSHETPSHPQRPGSKAPAWALARSCGGRGSRGKGSSGGGLEP